METFVTKQFGIEADVITRATDNAIYPGLVGVELEVEGFRDKHANVAQHFRYWKMKADGSLRDNGRELVFSAPLGGVDAVAAINELAALPPGLIMSERTSIHVHVDVRDLAAEQLLNFISAAIIMEQYLFRIAGPERRGNTFCLDTQVSDDVLLYLGSDSRYGWNPRHYLIYLIRNWAKYSGINIGAASSFGSIEFRHSRASADPEYILRWVNTLLSLRNVSKDIHYQELVSMLSARGAKHVVKLLIGELGFHDEQYEGLSDDMYTGARLIQDLTRAGNNMRVVDGSLARAYVEKNKGLRSADAVKIFEQLAAGMQGVI